MNRFKRIQMRAIQLSWQQLLLANSIVQSNIVYIRYPSPEQKSLAEKINKAKNASKPGYTYRCYFSPAEQLVMRQFNLEYCCLLVEHLDQNKERPGRSPIDALETYVLATQLYALFRSI